MKRFIGMTFKTIEVNEFKTEIVFTNSKDEKFLMYHEQD